jgi:hypothetical protein
MNLPEEISGLRDTDVLRASNVRDETHVLHGLRHAPRRADKVRERVLEILVIDAGQLRVSSE